MARVKGGLNAKKRHNRVLKLAKGYRGARSKQYRVAKQSVMRALTSSYAGHIKRERDSSDSSGLHVSMLQHVSMVYPTASSCTA